MVYVRLIREEKGRTICEDLNLNHGERQGIGIDRIILSTDCCNSTRGCRVTQEDFESLFRQKHNEAMKEIESRKSTQQKETEKQLEEMKRWKAETEGKSFIRQIAALWKRRKRNQGVREWQE